MKKLLRRLIRHLTLRVAAVLTLVALALMVWSVLVPTVMPVMVAMSVGQAIGTAAFAAYGWVVFHDLFKRRAERRSLQRIEVARRNSQRLEDAAKEAVERSTSDSGKDVAASGSAKDVS